jgi:hypothetical protein
MQDTYRVSGPFGYRGHEPGETFKADETEAIKRAVHRGAITREKASGHSGKSHESGGSAGAKEDN